MELKKYITKKNVVIVIVLLLIVVGIIEIFRNKKKDNKGKDKNKPKGGQPIQLVANGIVGMKPEDAEKKIKSEGYIARFRGTKEKELTTVSHDVRKDRVNYWVNCYGAKEKCSSQKVTESSVG